MNIIPEICSFISYVGSVRHKYWPEFMYVCQSHIFHGPVSLPYILKTIWWQVVIIGILVPCEQRFATLNVCGSVTYISWFSAGRFVEIWAAMYIFRKRWFIFIFLRKHICCFRKKMFSIFLAELTSKWRHKVTYRFSWYKMHENLLTSSWNKYTCCRLFNIHFWLDLVKAHNLIIFH